MNENMDYQTKKLLEKRADLEMGLFMAYEELIKNEEVPGDKYQGLCGETTVIGIPSISTKW